MKEFMLLIRNDSDAKARFSPDDEKQFIDACMVYIDALTKNGHLKAAQPLIREGRMVSGTPGAFKDGPYSESKEVIVGYYHILAKDIDEAIEIAKGNPEFTYTRSARIEVRPIKTREDSANKNYPSGK